jgi:amino acid transporter
VSATKKFGLFSLILLAINGIVGSGIFLLPGKAFALMGRDSLWVYLFDTILALLLALAFAEAGGRFDKTGGPYIYAKEAFGEFVGFEVGFIKWAISIIAWATMSVAFATALGGVWPWAGQGAGKDIVAVSLVVILAIVNILGVPLTKYFNNVATIGKLLPLVLFVAVGIFFVDGGKIAAAPAAASWGAGLVPTLILVFYAFTGFESIAVAAEDFDNPKRNVPIAVIVSILIASVIYFLTQYIAIGTLGPALATSARPVADAAGAFIGPFGAVLVTAGTLVSIGGINIASSFVTPRAGVALSEHGIMPKSIARLGRFGTPTIAIAISTILAIPLILTGTFVQLVAISVISRFAQYIPTSIAVIVFRRKMKDQKSTFMMPFGPVLPLLATALSVALLVDSAFDKGGVARIVWGLGALVIGVPIYFAMRATKGAATRA